MLDLELWKKIDEAARANDLCTLKTLLSQRPSPETLNHGDPEWFGRTPLHWASSRGRLEVTRLLVDAGANVDATKKDGYTPLHWSSYNGHLEVVKLLVEAGANVNATDEDGKTPRQLALDRRHDEVAELLSEAPKIQGAALKKANEELCLLKQQLTERGC